MAKSIKPCRADGCNRMAGEPGSAKGFCNKHYLRFKKFGDPNVTLIDRESTICGVEGCGGASYAKGFCTTHYARQKRHGSTDRPGGQRRAEWIEEHSSFQGDECLVWPFSVAPHGRGVVTFRGVTTSAPRAMCIAAHGEPKSGNLHAAHACGNGHKGCLNPRHLRWATPQDNERDKALHGTLRIGEAVNTCKLTSVAVEEIRSRLGAGERGSDLASEFGVSRSQISAIKTRKAWSWL